MAFSTIDKSSLYQNTVLYTGNGSSQSITGVGFQPDMTWFKCRSAAYEHQLYDAVRGVTKRIVPNDTTAEGTQANGLTAFGADGFTVDDANGTGVDTQTYTAWNWKANGAGSLNEVGSIDSTVSLNTTAGFSIVKYTGTGVAATVGHGLGAVPKMIIVRNLIDVEDWIVYHAANTAAPETDYLVLNGTDATADNAGMWNDTAPTSSVFSIGTHGGTNGPTDAQIAYCFAEIPGYSKFGSYLGNGNADGSFVYTGFKPAFLLTKQSSGAGEGWQMYDNKRLGYNVDNNSFYANQDYAEATGDYLDLCSNGFKVRSSNAVINGSGSTYIYMAFGQPIISNSGICATAR